jgi:hypothetical protein
MTTQTIKVAPTNPHKSKYPRLTHNIALAGGKDFHDAKVAFGLQVRPEDSKYPAIRVNTRYWRLRYTKEVDRRPVQVIEYKGEGSHLSEELAKWAAQSDRHLVITELTLVNGQSMSEALRDIRTNGSLYAFECTMATAIVRLFVSRRGVIGTKAKFGEKQEADKYFDDLYRTLLVEPLNGNVEVSGLKWLPDELPLSLADLKKGTSKGVGVGDWIYFDHHELFGWDDPFGGENALWLGDGTIYAHDYGMVSVTQYLVQVRQHDPSNSPHAVMEKTKVFLQCVSE